MEVLIALVRCSKRTTIERPKERRQKENVNISEKSNVTRVINVPGPIRGVELQSTNCWFKVVIEIKKKPTYNCVSVQGP